MGSDRKELDEKNFIQEHGSKFIWIFLFLFIFILALLLGINLWQRNLEKDKWKNSPFYQVTNREFSIFLWQNPQFMRSRAGLSAGYLPQFHTKDGIHVIQELADEYVKAPPEILYRYHVWKRLLGNSLSSRPIYQPVFYAFLLENPEWLPKSWKEAPSGYKKLINNLKETEMTNLQPLSYEVLPLEVRMAFQGWFNFMREWEQISTLFPTKGELEFFLNSHPHYARNYWRNLIPEYLLNLDMETSLSDSDFTPFLKIALFNFKQSQTPPDKQALSAQY